MTVHERTPVVVHVLPPGLDVTLYPVMAAPPLAVGAVHDTSLWATTALAADTLVGASGTCVIFVTEFPE